MTTDTQTLMLREQGQQQQALQAAAPQGLVPMAIEQAVESVRYLERALRTVMKDGVHYGKVPGCGDKPTLLKAGAEKIGMLFRLAPEFDVNVIEMANGHREYRIGCRMTTAQGAYLGEGVGAATTLESKWRYRWDDTGREVPREYWDGRDPLVLGGSDMAPRKVKGTWKIYRKTEHDNPADYYNTALKIAKKRALVDAVLTVTGASDLFEQDIEEMDEAMRRTAHLAPDVRSADQGQAEQGPADRASRSSGSRIPRQQQGPIHRGDKRLDDLRKTRKAPSRARQTPSAPPSKAQDTPFDGDDAPAQPAQSAQTWSDQQVRSAARQIERTGIARDDLVRYLEATDCLGESQDGERGVARLKHALRERFVTKPQDVADAATEWLKANPAK